MPAAGRAGARAMPAYRRATPWCWSTTAARPACSCWTWRGASPPRCRNGSGWRWSPSHAWSARTGEADGRGAPTASRAAARRAADAGQHGAVRDDGGGAPPGIGPPAHLRDRVLPQFLRRHGPGLLRTQHFPRYLFRCMVGICSMLAGFWAIGHLPLAQAISLSYSTPLFATIAAAALLGERVRARRWAAVVLGFVGVLVIVRPGTTGFSEGAMVAVLAALLSAIVAIQIKQLSATEPADRIVIWTTLLWVPMSLVPALGVWTWPQGITWLW